MCLRRICLATVLVVTAAGPAFALRCLPGDDRHVYEDVERFPDKMLVLGRITVDEISDDAFEKLVDPKSVGRGTTVSGYIEGHAYSGTSFDLPLATSIDITFACYPLFCKRLPRIHEGVYLLDRDLETDKLTFVDHLCPSVTFWIVP